MIMRFETINELAKEVHLNAVDKGFWENNQSDEHCLCLVISELMEAVEADRKGRHADVESFKILMDGCEELFYINFSNCIKDTIEDEISDAFIRLLDLAGSHKYIFDTEYDINMITAKKSFTENIYEIVQVLTYKKYSTKGKVTYVAQHIIKLAEILKIDLEYHVRLKMRYNSLREYKHGKAY